MKEPLLETKDVKKYFDVKSKKGGKKLTLKAVDGIDIKIYPGETVGLVGESGCGKSTLGRALLALNPATSGSIKFEGEEIVGKSQKQLRPLRKDMQIIFQDPYSSLDPRKTIFEAVRAPLKAFHIGTEGEIKNKVEDMLKFVGMGDYQFHKLPHELSGGQRQRAVIARAMILNPKFIVCDEPVSALDVSVRSQVLNLMKSAQKKTQLAYLFISHDMSVVRYLCDRVAVMYLGRIIELGNKEQIFNNPLHPYTQALLSAIPVPEVNRNKIRIPLVGDVPSPLFPPSGCRFHNRCPYAIEECSSIECNLVDTGEEHMVACPYSANIKQKQLVNL